jgi:penicillin V acylase-like amidase (Ntn superfamily)
VEEVLKNLADLRISKYLFGLHYFLCDRTGNTAVIEFIDGKTLIYTGEELEVPVLSNNSYENSVKYLGLFEGFGGNQPIIKRDGSQERFVRAAHHVTNHHQDASLSGREYAFQILDDVRQEDTRWQIVYQPMTSAISFYNTGKKAMIKLRMEDFGFTKSLFVNIDSISSVDWETNIPLNFKPLSYKSNSELIRIVFDKTVELEIIEPWHAEECKSEMLFYWAKLDQLKSTEIHSP